MPTYSVGKGITRFEIEATHSNGFMVRLCRKGERINEFFSDGAYGGKAKAKKAAQQRYQELLESYGPANTRPTKNLLTHRNQTGQVGVHIAHNVDKRWPGCEYYAYCASWTTEEGERKKIAFGWNQYGKDLAYKMACYARSKEISDRERVVKKFKGELLEYREQQAKRAKRTAKSAKSSPAVAQQRGRSSGALRKASATSQAASGKNAGKAAKGSSAQTTATARPRRSSARDSGPKGKTAATARRRG